MNKNSYLAVRHYIIIGNFNENVMEFLNLWCIESHKRFDILIFILEKGNQYGFINDLLQRLIIYLDKRFSVNKIIDIKREQIIGVY